MARILEILSGVWWFITKMKRRNIISEKPMCKCVFCKTALHDTDSLLVYIKNLESIVDRQKDILSKIENIPEQISVELIQRFEVTRAEAINKKHKLEAMHDNKILSGNSRAGRSG